MPEKASYFHHSEQLGVQPGRIDASKIGQDDVLLLQRVAQIGVPGRDTAGRVNRTKERSESLKQ